MWTSVVSFLAVSVPEQFLMALFAWIILGKSETAKFRNVVFVGISAAVAFKALQVILINNTFVIIPQVLVFAILIYYGYKLNVIESIIGCLVTLVVFTAVQGTTVNTILLITSLTEKEFLGNEFMRVVLAIPYLIVVCGIIFFMYRSNINIYYLKHKKTDKPYVSRIRFLVLQLTFAFLNLIIIFTIFLKNMEIFRSITNKSLAVLSFIITISFTIIVVKAVFKMGEIIQKEEELKRRYDGREIIQNINYMCSLIDAKEYGELRKTLEYMKNDIDTGMVNSKD